MVVDFLGLHFVTDASNIVMPHDLLIDQKLPASVKKKSIIDSYVSYQHGITH